MKHLIFCSFGKDSMASVLLAHLRKEPVDAVVYCKVMFDQNTSAEVPEHAEFIEKTIPIIENDFGFPVKIIQAEETYTDLFFKTVTKGIRQGLCRGSPLCRGCWVLRDLKLKPMQAFQRSVGEYISYIGIAHDEENRLQRLAGGTQISLLDKYGYRKSDIFDLDRKYNLLSPIYDFANRNGCFFCPNARDLELRHLRDHHSDLWQKMIEMESSPHVVKKNYNRNMTLCEMQNNFLFDDTQMRIF